MPTKGIYPHDENLSKAHNRIGLQLRNEGGKLVRTLHLSPDSVSATHPVILPVKKQQVLVAYTRKSGQKSEVWYQMLKL